MMKKQNQLVSIIIPSLNEAENLSYLLQKVVNVLKKNEWNRYQVIVIDDGSTDNTVEIIKKIRKKDKNIHVISFSRNFGHQAALKAGLELARGKCCISMDADLQHPPEVIAQLLKNWVAGFDIVYTIRQQERGMSLFKRLSSKIFYTLFQLLSGVHLEQGSADFRLLDQKVVKAICHFDERVLFLRGLVAWMGYSTKAIPYKPAARYKGKSHYTVIKMLKLAVTGITSFSVRPLYFTVLVGLFLSFFSGLYAFYAVTMFFFFDTLILPGWASILTSVLFIGGVQLILLGIIGIYIGNTYIETKHRPLYLIKSSTL